jgi:hypothetical protein
MFFSGDTAQCIATGVGFRFEDLTTLFKYERDRQDLFYKSQSLPEGLAVKIPIVKTLTVNYRTHNGILAAAGGILNMFLYLLTFFSLLLHLFYIYSLSAYIPFLLLHLFYICSWHRRSHGTFFSSHH